MEVVGVGGALRLGSGWRVHSVSRQESPRLFGARHHNIFVCVFFKMSNVHHNPCLFTCLHKSPGIHSYVSFSPTTSLTQQMNSQLTNTLFDMQSKFICNRWKSHVAQKRLATLVRETFTKVSHKKTFFLLAKICSKG